MKDLRDLKDLTIHDVQPIMRCRICSLGMEVGGWGFEVRDWGMGIRDGAVLS